jgi:acyl-CoA thioester hydrolase
MIKPYFPHSDDLIAPLKMTVKRRVRFEEVDALGIVWHGRYPGYFEDARTALGAAYDVGYLDFYKICKKWKRGELG